MKRLWLIPISALILIVGAGATAGLIAAGQERPSPAEQVQTVDKVAPDTPIPPDPASSVSSDDGSAPPLGKRPDIQYPNLGSALDQMVAEAENESDQSREADRKAADGKAADAQSEPTAVSIYLSGHVEDVVTFLEDNGGDPRNVGEDYIEAYVPVGLLGELSGQSGVLRVREIIPPMSN